MADGTGTSATGTSPPASHEGSDQQPVTEAAPAENAAEGAGTASRREAAAQTDAVPAAELRYFVRGGRRYVRVNTPRR